MRSAALSGARMALIVLMLAAVSAGAARAQATGCRPEGERGAARAESCFIAGTDYRLVRARATVYGTLDMAVTLLRDPASCTEWQAMCAEELFLRDGAAHRSIRHRRSGEGFTRRVVVSRNSWWRSQDGGVVADLAGDDHLAARFEGTRVLCLRERWTFTPLAGGRLQVTADVVSDPQPPFGAHRSRHLQYRRYAAADPGQLRGANSIRASPLRRAALAPTSAAVDRIARSRRQLYKTARTPASGKTWHLDSAQQADCIDHLTGGVHQQHIAAAEA